MSELLNNLGIGGCFIPEWVLCILFVVLLIAGVVVTIACRWLLKPLGMFLFVAGVVCVVWFTYACMAPTQYLEPPTSLQMVEQLGQQILVVPRTPGSSEVDVINLNRAYGRTFPSKSVFIIRYRLLSYVCRGVWFSIHNQTNSDGSLYVIDPPQLEPEVRQ